MRGAIVDAFTDQPFTGNPAGVVLLDPSAGPVTDAFCQHLAAELNQVETAFLRPLTEGRFGLRWFTPIVEVPICGHATLASAHWLWETKTTQVPALTFETRSGPLSAIRESDGRVRLDFPLMPTNDRSPVPGLLEALGLRAPDLEDQGLEGQGFKGQGSAGRGVVVGRTGAAGEEGRHALVIVDAPTLRALHPDLTALARVDTAGVIVSARGDEPGIDIISRFFAPRIGIDEDPVTGSAHCTLAEYWPPHLGRPAFRARQISTRGGTVDVSRQGDRVALVGAAITVAELCYADLPTGSET